MSGPKRNPDRLNTIGVVVVGICGAVLVYVTIVALQAFYMDDTSEIQTMADYGGQDTDYKSLRSEQKKNISEVGPNAAVGGKQTYRIPIDNAINRWTLHTLPPDWTTSRDRWQAYHTSRTFASLAGFGCALAAILWNSDDDQLKDGRT